MNSKLAKYPIDSIVEVGFIISPKIAYDYFLCLNDLNILLHVVYHLWCTSIGIVKSWHICASKILYIEKNVDNFNLNGVWRFLMNQRFGMSFVVVDEI